VDDLDLDLALASLIAYREQLHRAPLTRDALSPLLREQGLMSVNENGVDEVTNGAILLFGKEPQKFLPHPGSLPPESSSTKRVCISQRKRGAFAPSLTRALLPAISFGFDLLLYVLCSIGDEWFLFTMGYVSWWNEYPGP
jgi:hypothetical protein